LLSLLHDIAKTAFHLISSFKKTITKYNKPPLKRESG